MVSLLKNTNSQHNQEPAGNKLSYRANCVRVPERFPVQGGAGTARTGSGLRAVFLRSRSRAGAESGSVYDGGLSQQWYFWRVSPGGFGRLLLFAFQEVLLSL